MESFIKNPNNCNESDIITDIKSENNTTIITGKYPNGFSLKIAKDGNNFTITPSGEVIDLGNGCYQIPD